MCQFLMHAPLITINLKKKEWIGEAVFYIAGWWTGSYKPAIDEWFTG